MVPLIEYGLGYWSRNKSSIRSLQP